MKKQKPQSGSHEGYFYHEQNEKHPGVCEFQKRMSMTTGFIAFFLTIILFSSSCSTRGEYILESSTAKLVIKDSRIASIFDKARQIEHVAPLTDSTVGLFRIQLVKGIHPLMDIDATQMTSKVLRKKSNSIEMEFNHAKATVLMQVNLSKTDGEIEWSISVTPSDTSLVVGSVAYPVFETPVVADGTVKNCLLPQAEGKFHPINAKVKFGNVYPANLFAQLVACIEPKGGFLIWCDDTVGNVKQFNFNVINTKAEFSVIHRMPYEPGEWKSPYVTRISFCDSSWYDAADIYRNWADKQYWSTNRLKDRTDVPGFLHHPLFFTTVQLGKEKKLEEVPDRLADLGRILDAPVLVRGTFWEKRGGWVGIDYFPPCIGEKKLRSFAKSLNDRNITLICEVSGFTWMKGNEKGQVLDLINNMPQEQRDDLAKFFNENNGQDLCEIGLDGKLSSPTKLCRGSSPGKSFIQNTAVRLFDLGITAYHHDSDIGLSPDGISGCFNTAHGHPVPCGPWSTEITMKAFREVKAEAARRGISNFLLIKEYCSELLNMEVHAYLARMSWTYTKQYVVPLSQYLYHEYLPVVLYNTSPDELADIIVFGQVPGGSSMLSTMPAFKDYINSMKSYSKDFLLYGRMLKPVISGIPVSSKTIAGNNGAINEITFPLIRHSVWNDGAGNIGVFAINTQKLETIVKVPVPGKGKWQATFYLGDSEQVSRTVIAGESLEWNLPPDRLAAVVLKPVN